MSDRLRGLAGVLIGYSAGVGPGELVLLEGPVTAEPLIDELYRMVLRAGGHPVTRVAPELEEYLLAEGSDQQVEWVTQRSARTSSAPTCGS